MIKRAGQTVDRCLSTPPPLLVKIDKDGRIIYTFIFEMDRDIVRVRKGIQKER